jgi:hypothetical protein
MLGPIAPAAGCVRFNPRNLPDRRQEGIGFPCPRLSTQLPFSLGALILTKRSYRQATARHHPQIATNQFRSFCQMAR